MTNFHLFAQKEKISYYGQNADIELQYFEKKTISQIGYSLLSKQFEIISSKKYFLLQLSTDDRIIKSRDNACSDALRIVL